MYMFADASVVACSTFKRLPSSAEAPSAGSPSGRAYSALALESPRAPPLGAPGVPDLPMDDDMTSTPPWRDPIEPFVPGAQDGNMG